LFLKVVDVVIAYDFFSSSKGRCYKLARLSSIQKCTIAIPMLEYGLVVDATNEY
jgi:hypothetical protein